MLWINAVYELPFGRDQRFLNTLHPVADAILGGWQLSGINSFVSGAPLSINVPGRNAGQRLGHARQRVGRSGRGRPVGDQWFNTAAFSAPAALQYGNSPIGIVEGPAAHILDLGLMKSFSLGEQAVHPGPGRGLQRAEQGEPRQSGHHARHRELRAHPERGRRAHDAVWPEVSVLGMATGQIYMLLGLLSFSMLGVLHKVADVKHSRPAAINALLASSSLLFVFAFVMFGDAGRAGGPRQRGARWPFRSASSASIAILAFQAGVKHGNIATSWLAINLSAGIPTVASILIYDEPVGTGKALALALIPVSMFLLWKDKKAQELAPRDASAP